METRRWAGVPFYVRTGKLQAERVTEIVIQFKRAPQLLFSRYRGGEAERQSARNAYPTGRGYLAPIQRQDSGRADESRGCGPEYDYQDYCGAAPWIGYETLLLDCMIGDQTLFQRADMVEAGWRVVAPLLDVWNALPGPRFPQLRRRQLGPKDADHMLEREGRQWRVRP